ncbi:catechol 2,3-dioxygenase-like lactoylglutathione lyase family enzyme [Salinibacterium sp. CAN_S4]|uniref:VOC family protein n=1 Tax=Salinibacterium sp. CAN_S4 TaxID=2787727 RepID=UPI0018F0437A
MNENLATRLLSVSVPVHDQNTALDYYRDVLGMEVRVDEEAWPGARWLEVAPPGSSVSIVLLPRDSGFPIGIRLGTEDADAAHEALTAAATIPDTEVLHTDFDNPMFSFADPAGNVLVLIQDNPDS